LRVVVAVLDRHARQLVLPEVGPAGQRRLRAARVAVVGCGGLGAPVIAQLAAAGVGHLTLCDDDVVEGSNLNRQTLFGVNDLGARKAEVAAAFVRRLDPLLAVDAVIERVTSLAAARLLSTHDLVIDASDGFPTKYVLNDVAVELDRPLVHGAATGWSGQVLVVPGRRGPCLRCLFPSPPPPGSTPTCRTAGILAPTTGVVGSLQAAAALRLLLGVGDAAGRFTAVDVKEGATRTLRFGKEPTCPACGLHRTARGVRDDEATDDDSEDEKGDSGCLLAPPGAGPVTTTDRPDGER
jgi:molybdopterin/thiamine biosynthesis adenylyltransferase